MRPDQEFLTDILDNAKLIIRFVSEVSREAFHQDDMRKLAVEKGIERIGEAMKNISAATKTRYPNVFHVLVEERNHIMARKLLHLTKLEPEKKIL